VPHTFSLSRRRHSQRTCRRLRRGRPSEACERSLCGAWLGTQCLAVLRRPCSAVPGIWGEHLADGRWLEPRPHTRTHTPDTAAQPVTAAFGALGAYSYTGYMTPCAVCVWGICVSNRRLSLAHSYSFLMHSFGIFRSFRSGLRALGAV
jgi:hypothetical protein